MLQKTVKSLLFVLMFGSLLGLVSCVDDEPAHGSLGFRTVIYSLSKYEVLNDSLDFNGDGIVSSDLLQQSLQELGDSSMDLSVGYFRNRASDNTPNNKFNVSLALLRQEKYPYSEEPSVSIMPYGFGHYTENYTPYHFEVSGLTTHDGVADTQFTPFFKVVSFKQFSEHRFEMIVETDYYDFATDNTKTYRCLVQYSETPKKIITAD